MSELKWLSYPELGIYIRKAFGTAVNGKNPEISNYLSQTDVHNRLQGSSPEIIVVTPAHRESSILLHDTLKQELKAFAWVLIHINDHPLNVEHQLYTIHHPDRLSTLKEIQYVQTYDDQGHTYSQ